MRIVVAPVGARGDVLPMIGLSRELQNRGHYVSVCAPEMYRSLVMKQELFIVSTGSSFQELLEGIREGDRGTDLVLGLSQIVATQFVSLRDALREADVLIGSMLLVAGPSMAEQRKIPYFYIVGNPILLDRSQYPAPGIPREETSGMLGGRRRKYRAQQWEESIGKAINAERENTHLEPVSDMYAHIFHSGHLIAAMGSEFLPAGVQNVPATGFLHFANTDPIDPEVEKYLSAGAAPVLLGPLSEAVVNSASVLRRVCEGIMSSGSRVLVSSAWPGIQPSDLPDGCRLIETSECSRILERTAAVVHGGTTEFAAGCLYAGVPQVVAPHLMDQAFWAERLQSLGVGLTLSEFSLKQVIDGVQQALSPAMKERASAMGESVRKGNGVASTADQIEKLLP